MPKTAWAKRFLCFEAGQVDRILKEVGFAVCHQLPSHSVSYGGMMMPLCARCTGIYAGFLFASTFLLVMSRLQRRGPTPAWITCLSMAFFAAMAVDVFSSFLGWRQTNNTFRLATGALVGSALPVLGWPLSLSVVWEDSSKEERIIKTWESLLLAGGYVP